MRFAIALLLCLSAARAADLAISTDFPGGAAEVVKIDQADRLITFKVPQQKNGGWQSWWYLKVSGITPGETIKLHLTNGQAHALRAVWSADGKKWAYTAAIEYDARRKPAYYEQKIDADAAYFAWYAPHLPAEVKTLADQAAKLPFVKVFELCKSEEGIPVIGFRFSEGDARDRAGVWIHGRQHAWETGGSWTAHGLAQWLMSDDPRAKNLRAIADITLIPIIDVDSVQGGRGGKEQKPYDHNRDWIDKPIWKAIQSAKSELERMDQAGKLDLFLDLHDPGWAGAVEFWCHTYNVMAPARRHNTDIFLAAAKREISGPLIFDGKPTIKYSLATPTSGIWSTTKTREKVVGGTFEIGVAPPKGFDEPPPAHHLICGKQIGLAVEKYLADSGRKK